MTSRIIVGTEECPTRWIVRIIKSSTSFHLFHEKWPSVARDLELKEEDIKKLRKNMLLEKDELTDVVHEIISIWVGQEGSGATLDKLFASFHSNELGSIADLIKNKFTLKSSRWDVPSYYISRTLISRNVLDKNKFMEELQSAKDIFIFTGITMSGLSNILQNKMVENSTRIVQQTRISHNYILLDYPTHFSKICEKASVPVHLIKFDENGDKWILVKSSGSLSAMQNIINKRQIHLKEIELISSIADETRSVCISDSPGMGKSTLLQHIGQKLSKTDNNRRVLFATMSEIVTVFMQNDANDEEKRKASLKLTLNKLFCSNAAQTSFLSLKLNSEDLQIELLLDGLDEVASSNTSFALDLLKYLLTIPSIRVWVTTRAHMLQDVENILNIFGYNIQAFTKENQISFLKDFWFFHNKNLVTDRLEQFAEICLSELNSKVSRKDRDIAGIPLQCLLIGEVYEEQAQEHSVATNPNESWIIHINSLAELYQRLIEKQYSKYKMTSSQNLLTEEQIHKHHIILAVQLIFPELLEKLPVSFKTDVNLNELLKVGLLEKSSTVLEPKFVHRTIGEFLIAKFLVQLLNLVAENETLNCLSRFLNKVLECHENSEKLYARSFSVLVIRNNFVKNEICHFFDTLLECDKVFFFDIHLNFKTLLQACIYGDYFNLFKTFLFQFVPNDKSSAQKMFDDQLLYLAVKYSGVAFLEIILGKNPTLLHVHEMKVRLLLLSIHCGKLAQLRYLLNVSDVRELVTHPNDVTKYVIHECVQFSAKDSISIVKQKTEILEILLDINPDLLEQLDKDKRTPILYYSIHEELLRKFIQRNANVLAIDSRKQTILHAHCSEMSVMFEELPTEKLKFLVKLKNSGGETPLMTLVKKQEPSLEILTKFKIFGADFNCEDNEGYSLLARSILKFRTTETIERLVECGANVHWRKGWKRQSLLHIAAKCGNVDAMRFLETQFKMNINERDWSFKSADQYLIEFCKRRFYNLSNQQINYLIDMTNDLNLSLSSENKAVMLERSVGNMNYSAVEHFLKDGADFLKNNDRKFRILYELIRNFELKPGRKILKSLINFGIIEVHNNSLIVFMKKEKHYLLHWAIERGGLKIVTCLVDEYKQNVNGTDDDGKTPLQYLIKSGFNLEKANFLLSKGADATLVDGDGNTFLHLAFEVNKESVTWCLNLGLDVNAANAKGESPLHKLVSGEWYSSLPDYFISKVILLCDHEANALQVDKQGWNAIHHMADSYRMYQEGLKFFLEKGLDINAVDKEGNTPLHIAAQKCSNQSTGDGDGRIQLLLEKGADKTIRNKNGKTPYAIHQLEILKL